MTLHQDLPIGIFDSGVGGLTVFRAIHQRLPGEHLLYLGDTARLPYGTKSRDTVASYSLQAAENLVERGIKMLVVACNTATFAALPALREAFAPLPVIGVVEPGAAAAVRASKSGRIAVIATECTIVGGAYQQAISHLRKDAIVIGQPCTLFVSLAEEGWIEGPIVEGVAARYLDHLFKECEPSLRPDTLLLGCTHFPSLRVALSKVVGEEIFLVDPAVATAEVVELELKKQNLLGSGRHGRCHFMTTDDVKRFARVGSLLLGVPLEKNCVERVDL